MSLKRREILAWLLLLLTALTFSFGITLLADSRSRVPREPGAENGTEAPVYTTWAPPEESSVVFSAESTVPPTEDPEAARLAAEKERLQAQAERDRIYSLILCGLGALLAGAAVFVLRQKIPLLGPDGWCLLTTCLSLLLFLGSIDCGRFWKLLLLSFAGLGALRELWGWVRARLSLNWCICTRISKPRPVLLRYSLWLALPLLLTGFTVLSAFGSAYLPLTILRLLRLLCAFVLVFACLIRYYRESMGHFQAQLERFRADQDVELREGPFEKTEEKLRSVQLQRREALARAVAEERFRVDLIANVSHDLRTPLTAIVGYGELLESQALDEAGKNQLNRLNQKASYMRDLVDSLFELTKVSSGVLEPKRSPLDLVRLLEQTLGLYDERLSAAGLTVKRRYALESAPLESDGAMLHQIFANLLGNAVKYALHGTRIHLELTETEAAYRVRLVNTASYEMDFTPEEIIQRFARGDKARSTQGSGIGLAIAQTYTEALCGQFRILIDGDQFNAIVTLPKKISKMKET